MQVRALLTTSRERLDARSVLFDMLYGKLFFGRPLARQRRHDVARLEEILSTTTYG